MARRLSSSQKQARVLHRRMERYQEEKANPMYTGMTAFADMPEARTMPKNYKNYSDEGYGQNDTLYKVVTYGMQNGAAIPPKLFTDRTMQTEIKSHPLLDKLDRPNLEQDGVFYRESVLGYYLISGNSFQYANRVAKSGPPDELWALEPDKVKPVPDEKRGIAYYKVDYFAPEKQKVDPSIIGHMRSWNPKDPFFGLSPVQVAAILIDQQKAIRTWNLSLLQNKAVPSGAWTTDVILSPNDRAKTEARLNEKMAGYRNAGRVPLLDGALKWQSSAISPSDLDWLEGAKYNAGGIANIYNMPPQLIGDTSSTTYDNMQEAKAASYTEFIFPMLDKLYSLWNRWLLPMYPDLQNAYLYYDKETVEVVQAVIQSRLTAAAQRANQAWMQGSCMMDEAREMQGLPPLPNGAGQVFRFGAVLVLADDLKDYAEQSMSEPAAPPVPVAEPLPPPGQLPGQPQPNEEKPDGNNAPSNPDKQPAKPTGKQPDSDDDNQTSGKSRVLRSTKALDLRTTEEKSAYAASIEAARRRHEDEYEKQLAEHFEKERKAVFNAINTSASRSAHILASRAEGALNNWQDDLKSVLTDLYTDVSVDIGGQVAAQLSGKKGAISDFIAQFGQSQLRYLLTLAGMKIKQITNTTLAKIRLELTDGVAQGESIPELAKRIDALYLDEIIPNRSTTIARTEVVSSSNYASVEAAKSSGLQLMKVWLATEDSRTRPAHAAADGQEVPMDQAFDVGGESLMYPGDMDNGSANNIVNCRCTVYYKRAPQADTDDTADDSEEEKRIAKLAYKRFMDEVLV